jgi:hypothetical protein
MSSAAIRHTIAGFPSDTEISRMKKETKRMDIKEETKEPTATVLSGLSAVQTLFFSIPSETPPHQDKTPFTCFKFHLSSRVKGFLDWRFAELCEFFTKTRSEKKRRIRVSFLQAGRLVPASYLLTPAWSSQTAGTAHRIASRQSARKTPSPF